MKKFLPCLIVFALLAVAALWARAAYENRLNELVDENNRLADSAQAVIVRNEETGLELAELRSHLATTEDQAAELVTANEALDRRNRQLGRRLGAALNANARLEAIIEGGVVADPTVDADTVRATFAGVKESNGDTIGYHADVVIPLADPPSSMMTAALFATLTVDTRHVWSAEGEPTCQVSIRHENVTAVPGRCVEVLGDRPIEEAARIKLLGLDLSSPAALAIVGGTSLTLGLIVGLLVGG